MGIKVKDITGRIVTDVKNRAARTILDPLNQIVDQNITEVTTTIGAFVIRSIRGKFQRSITFQIGVNYYDKWMEEALYGILYTYNDIKKSSRLEITNKKGMANGTGMYYQLDDGTHNLKYRKYDILLAIQTSVQQAMNRSTPIRTYTVITYNLDPEFVTLFEKDMLRHRNALLDIKADRPTIDIYEDYHEQDGWTYWEKKLTIPKRRLSTVYLPKDTKKKIVTTVNEFFASKKYYINHGIAHNLKILLYGPPGTGKDSIAKMIASEWNRNIYYITGGKDGKYIPNAITDDSEAVNHPLLIISDIDKYPYLINEPDTDMTKGGDKDDNSIKYKQLFGNMINSLDGILSAEDRIIVMTTNHIEKFSDTFMRPGRINLKLEIPYINEEVFRKYTYDYYNRELPKDIKLKQDNLTIAALQDDVMFMKLTADEFIKKYLK